MSRRVVDRRTSLGATGGTAGLGPITGCSGGGDGADGDSGDDGGSGAINIGSIQPLVGNFAPWRQVHSSGLAFDVQEINDDGGALGGRELNIVEVTSDAPGVSAPVTRPVPTARVGPTNRGFLRVSDCYRRV